MTTEVVQNGLPPLLLLLDRMSWFTIEGDSHSDTIWAIGKLDLRRTVAERVLNQLGLCDSCIGAGEIKPDAAVLCLHARGEGTPTRKSTSALVVSQSSDAAFHCLMFSGVVYARQTCSMGAATVVSTLIFMESILFDSGAPARPGGLRCQACAP